MQKTWSTFEWEPLVRGSHFIHFFFDGVFCKVAPRCCFVALLPNYLLSSLTGPAAGGVGVEPGTVIVTTEALNGMLEPVYELPILGKKVARPSKFDADLVRTIVQVMICFAFDLLFVVAPSDVFFFSVCACIVLFTAASCLLPLHSRTARTTHRFSGHRWQDYGLRLFLRR